MIKSDKKVEHCQNGHKKITTNYPHGQVTVEYDENENILSSKIQLPSGFFIEKSDHKTTIQSQNYHSETASLSEEEQVHEQQIGKWKQVYTTKNGKKDGLFKSYHPNGCLFEEKNYKNGLLEGESKSYDEFGHLLYKNFYKNDQKIKSELYSLDGKKIKTTLYTPDKKPKETTD